MRETAFIAALAGLPLHPGADGLRDDAAVLDARAFLDADGSGAMVLTHDMLAEGVHYRVGTDPFDIAWKLVAANLSDLAAKGAEPVGVLVGASLGPDMDRFVAGLRAILMRYHVPLLGGDTIRPLGPASFGCTAVGRATVVPVPRRHGARVGDTVVLAGRVGAARLGFLALEQGVEAGNCGEVIAAYLRPEPLLREGLALAPHVHAMMDISDGLLLDARRMGEASDVTVALDSAAVTRICAQDASGTLPVQHWRAAASWGDDYALLATLSPGTDIAALPVTPIGTVMPRCEEPLLVDAAPVTGALGWEHG